VKPGKPVGRGASALAEARKRRWAGRQASRNASPEVLGQAVRPSFPLVGASAALLCLALSIASLILFEKGQPGAPEFPDERNVTGFQDSVTLYTPSGVGIRYVSMDASLSRAEGSPDMASALQLQVTAASDAYPVDYDVVLELRGSARLVDPTSAGRPMSHTDFADTQLVVLDLDRSGRADIGGSLLTPASSTQNFRTSFAPPYIGFQLTCSDLPGGSLALQIPRMNLTNWRVMKERCGLPAYPVQTVLRLRDGGNEPFRVDSILTAPPCQETGPFIWQIDDASGMVVRASFANVNGEAETQRLFFLSSIAVGLAAALAPIAGVKLARYRKSLRECRRDSTQSNVIAK
jgi:hypothetical protein